MKYLPAYVRDKLSERADFETNFDGHDLFDHLTKKRVEWFAHYGITWFHWMWGFEVEVDYHSRRIFFGFSFGPFTLTVMRDKHDTLPQVIVAERMAQPDKPSSFSSPCPNCHSETVCFVNCPARTTFLRFIHPNQTGLLKAVRDAT